MELSFDKAISRFNGPKLRLYRLTCITPAKTYGGIKFPSLKGCIIPLGQFCKNKPMHLLIQNNKLTKPKSIPGKLIPLKTMSIRVAG